MRRFRLARPLAVLLLLAAAFPRLCAAQAALVPLVVEVVADGRPIVGAEVVVDGQLLHTDNDGRVTAEVAPGSNSIVVRAAGFYDATTSIAGVSGAATRVRVELEARLGLEEEVVVTATRTGTRLQDQPVRVELIDREEIEEKALMTPGSVAMLLGETTGLRVQTTSASLGSGNVRIQGLRGRYAQLLADGLPLYGGQSDSFSLFQVPPLDLGQVEIIKGVASALYGASALGGVINLVSRRPREDEVQVLANVTGQSGRDLTTWLARAPTAAGWSWSLIGGYHGQSPQDLDGDGWSDVPAYERGTVRPRLFFDNSRGRTLLATVGATVEDRRGGTLHERVAPDGSSFVEQLVSRRADAGVTALWLTAGGLVASLRGSAMWFEQDRRFGLVRERAGRSTWFGEASLRGAHGRHTWVAGGAFQQDDYRPRDVRAFEYAFSTPSIFTQDEIALGRHLTVALSARVDAHSEYGILATPRVSILARPADGWVLRLATGTGTFAPTPFTEETEETGLSQVLPFQGVIAERARGGSADVTRTIGPFEVTGTVFASRVAHPLQARVTPDERVALVNADGPTRSWGTEFLTRYRAGDFTALFTHAWTRSTERDPEGPGRREVPLTPGHTLSFNAMWEAEGRYRFGIESYYVGRQSLDDNPYREHGRAHVLIGALIERRVGRARLFLNSENLLDVRQTKWDPLVLPQRRPDGRWTVDAWAPLDGRVINGGVRVAF